MAEIVLFGSDGNPPLRTTLGPGDYKEVMEPMDDDGRRRPARAVERRAAARSGSSGRSATERLRRYLDGRRVTDAMLAMLPGEDARDRHDHARQPLRRDPLVQRRRPEAVRDARQQRQRRAPVRPPRAGGAPAARAAGAAPPPGLPRPAHRPRQPRPVHQPGQGRARGAARARSPSCSSTSTTSRPSTTASATPPATSCWSRSPTRLRECVRPGRRDRAPRRRRVRRDGPGQRATPHDERGRGRASGSWRRSQQPGRGRPSS